MRAGNGAEYHSWRGVTGMYYAQRREPKTSPVVTVWAPLGDLGRKIDEAEAQLTAGTYWSAEHMAARLTRGELVRR